MSKKVDTKAKKPKKSPNELIDRLVNSMQHTDIRNAKSTKNMNLGIPDSLRLLIDADIEKLNKACKINLTRTTYLILCAMIVGGYGQNEMLEFYRLKGVVTMDEYIKLKSVDLKLLFAEYILKNRRSTF